MGASVVWSSNEKKVYIDKEDVFIVLGLDDTQISVNGVTKPLVVPAISVNQKIMIPLRFISEEIGYEVNWIGETKTITIDEKKESTTVKPDNDKEESDKPKEDGEGDQTESEGDSKGDQTESEGDSEGDQTESEGDSEGNQTESEGDSEGNQTESDGDNEGDDAELEEDESPEQDSTELVQIKNITYYPEENTINLIKPQGIQKDKIVVNEKHLSKEIVITLDQEYSDFYEEGIWAILDDCVQKIEIQHNENTKIIVTTSNVQALNINETDESLLFGCVKPNEKYEKIVVVDAGHGAHDPGPSYQETKEKDIVIEVALKLKELLKEDNTIKVYMTREGDTFLSPYERAILANEIEPDLFVSIHVNSAGTNTSARGIETYYTPKEDTRNKVFADMVQNKLIETFNTRDRGVKENVFIVTKNTEAPSILVEMGFLSNQEDRAMMLAEGANYKYANVIYDCIIQYYNQGLNE